MSKQSEIVLAIFKETKQFIFNFGNPADLPPQMGWPLMHARNQLVDLINKEDVSKYKAEIITVLNIVADITPSVQLAEQATRMKQILEMYMEEERNESTS